MQECIITVGRNAHAYQSLKNLSPSLDTLATHKILQWSSSPGVTCMSRTLSGMQLLATEKTSADALYAGTHTITAY